MKLVGKGGKITLWIPAELAYGERGAGRDIGANEALEFSVEVVDVKPYVEPAPADSTNRRRSNRRRRVIREKCLFGRHFFRSLFSTDLLMILWNSKELYIRSCP